MGNLSRRRSGILVSSTLLILVLAILAYQGVSRLGRSRFDEQRLDWERDFGTPERVFERFPARQVNETALKVEAIAALLGIDLAPRAFHDRVRPSREIEDAHQRVKVEIVAWVADVIEKPRRDPEPPPVAVAAFLDAHGPALDEMVRVLLNEEIPQWERQLDRLFAAPLPNLLGHIHVQRLLVADALARSSRGDGRGALDDLEASWRLNESLRGDPTLIEQLIAVAVSRMQTGAVRQIEGAPPEWRERLDPAEWRVSFLTALGFEGWLWSQVEAHRGNWFPDRESLLARVAWPVVRPVVGLSIADVSGKYGDRLKRLAAADVLCDRDFAALGMALDVEPAWWNYLSPRLDPELTRLSGSIKRLARLELDLELTSKILEIEADREANGGAWPSRVPGIETSAVCPDDRWSYAVSPDGSAILAFSREISWAGLPRPILPTRFTVGTGAPRQPRGTGPREGNRSVRVSRSVGGSASP